MATKSRVWIFLMVISALMLGIALRFPIFGVERHIEYHLASRAVPLWIHIVVSAPAILFAPFQFWEGFRTRHRTLHKWFGYTSMVSMMFGGVSAINLALAMPIPTWGQYGFVVGATLWMTTGLIAVSFARARKIAAHKTWMIIYAATLYGSIAIRVEFPFVKEIIDVEFATAYAITAWSSWMGNLLIVTLWNRKRLFAGQMRFA